MFMLALGELGSRRLRDRVRASAELAFGHGLFAHIRANHPACCDHTGRVNSSRLPALFRKMPFDAQLTLLEYVARHYVSCDFGTWRLMQALIEQFRRERRISVKERVASAFKVSPKQSEPMSEARLIERASSVHLHLQRHVSATHLKHAVGEVKAEAEAVSEPGKASTIRSVWLSRRKSASMSPSSPDQKTAPDQKATADAIGEHSPKPRYRVSPAARARWDVLASVVLTDSVSKAQQRQRDQRIAYIIDELERLSVRAIDEINGWQHQKTYYSAASLRMVARAKSDTQKLSLAKMPMVTMRTSRSSRSSSA
jgi:hypothetical protein